MRLFSTEDDIENYLLKNHQDSDITDWYFFLATEDDQYQQLWRLRYFQKVKSLTSKWNQLRILLLGKLQLVYINIMTNQSGIIHTKICKNICSNLLETAQI